MSKKMMSAMAAGFLLAAVAAFASDAWKDKDFQNWDQKDVQKILTDSPWSKKFQYAANGSAGNGGMTHSISASPAGGGATAGGGAGTPGNPSDRLPPGAQESGQQINLAVTWYSARTIREAMARKKEFAGASADDARKILSQEPTAYEVAVSGPDLRIFGTIQEDNLKEHSYLMPKTTKEKLAPAEIIVQRGQNDQPIAIIFAFAKTTPSGAPSIAKNEKGVEFFTQAENMPIRIQFDLTKMLDKQGEDY
jgi:hypothetical protein